MTFSLADFMGYCMSVISAIEDLNLSPEDFHNWEVRLDGVRCISGSSRYDVSLIYDVSLRQLKSQQRGHKESRRNKSVLCDLSLQARKKPPGDGHPSGAYFVSHGLLTFLAIFSIC